MTDKRTRYDLHIEIDEHDVPTVSATLSNGRKTRKHPLTRHQRQILWEVLQCCRLTLPSTPPSEPSNET